MSSRKTRDLRKALTAKGFEAVHTHHDMFWLCVGGKRSSVRTRISHGASEYGENLLGQMARQLGLSRTEFDDFIECPLSEEQYVDLLAERGRLSSD